jgi:predicted PurR-regulated permease PerM
LPAGRRCASGRSSAAAASKGALTTARVIQQVVDSTSTYLGTITVINVSLGALTALILWQLGMTSPVMWGGIVAVLNYIPYLGPIAASLLLFLGGPDGVPRCLVGDASAVGVHRAAPGGGESDHSDGRRREAEINPLAILISLSFWAWVWGTTGASRGSRC